jgi:uncharacterized cupin superfamily protein
MVEEARLEDTGAGLEPASEGWFVVNVADAAWQTSEAFAAACGFEGEGTEEWDVGFTLAVLWPGKPSALYHRESNQEDFLVLAGECVLLVDGQERRLKAWDFVHLPPDTDHIVVGAGDGPCVVLMTGSRDEDEVVVYPVSELARRHGAGVEQETSSPEEAYARFEARRPGRPDDWDRLPWT